MCTVGQSLTGLMLPQTIIKRDPIVTHIFTHSDRVIVHRYSFLLYVMDA